jgi:hypothetical protein
MSPDGRFFPYAATIGGDYEPFLLDTLTGEQLLGKGCGDWWLTNTVQLGGSTPPDGYSWEFVVCDISGGGMVSAQWAQGIEEATSQLQDGTRVFNPEVVEWFSNAEQVYYIKWMNWAVALGSDFLKHPENNYVLAIPRSGRYWDTRSILKFLDDNQIAYTEIDRARSGSAGPSHDGHFIARFDGFFTAEGRNIGPMYDSIAYIAGSPVAYGWAYDDSGVYVQFFEGGSLWIFPRLPPKQQPILKINLSPEYLSPAARQAVEARQAQERAAQLQRTIFWIAVVLALAGLAVLWWRRKAEKAKRIAS